MSETHARMQSRSRALFALAQWRIRDADSDTRAWQFASGLNAADPGEPHIIEIARTLLLLSLVAAMALLGWVTAA